MKAVKNRNTKPEILIRKRLFREGFRYKITCKELPGSPDIVLLKHKTVIFVHGCFWHGHNDCHKSIKPNSNVIFWETKIKINKERDIIAKKELIRAGWDVITVWECDLRNKESFEISIKNVVERLNSNIILAKSKVENT
jgi:DNA mismatch endonuclease, patch repair protein